MLTVIRRFSNVVFAAVVLLLGKPAAAQPNAGVVTVVVSDARTAQAVQDAEVSILRTMIGGRTDSLGKVTLEVPSESGVLRIRRLGYRSKDIVLNADRELVVVRLEPAPQRLREVTINDSVAFPLHEFEHRRKNNIGGYFITPNEFRAYRGGRLSDLVARKIPGLAIYERSPFSGRAFSKRGGNRFGQDCQVVVYLDGIKLGDGNVNTIAFNLLGALEYYAPAFAPVQYRSSSSYLGGVPVDGSPACGVLLLWTDR